MKQLHPAVSALIWVVLSFLLIAAVVNMSGSRMLSDLVIHVGILGLFAVSLNILIGYTGMVAFGHAMFFASGAYGFGLLMQTGDFSIPAAILVSLLGSAAIALIVGIVCLNTREIYFAFLTLAIQMMFYSSLLSWVEVTGGDQGLTGGFEKPVFLGLDMTRPDDAFLFITATVLLTLGILWHVTRTPFGHVLRMIRDNATRVEFFGLNVRAYRLGAFVIASAAASVAGALMSLYVSAAYPNFGYWTMSGEAIFMIMLGGLNTFLGPLVGAAILALLNHYVTAYTEYYGLVLGAIILVYVLVLRRGILDIVVEKFAGGKKGFSDAKREIPATKEESRSLPL